MLKKIFAVWLFFFVIATIILSHSQFTSSSNDSKYYTQLVIRYENAPLQNILTSKWGENFWSNNPDSYNFDIFPGQTLLGVGMTKFGAPAPQALHILGMIFQIGSIFLLVLIAREFIPYEEANVLFYSILLTPMAFSYNLRANHELGIMFFSFLALYAGLKIIQNIWWIFALVFSVFMLFWIKGPFVIFGLMLSSIGIFFSNFNLKRKLLFSSVSILISSLLVFISAIYFEDFYKSITGLGFFNEFYRIQIESRQLARTAWYSFITLKLYNFYYYFWHMLVYALPWFLLLVIALFKTSKAKFLSFLKSRLSLLLLFSLSTYLFVFTVNSRHAARYVFPIYYLFSAWSILGLLNLSSLFQKIHLKLMRAKIYLIAPALWFCIFLLHFL